MISSMAQSFEQYLNCLWCYIFRFSSFCDFRVFVFGYKAQNEYLGIKENLYLGIYEAQMQVYLFFDHLLTF